MKQLPVVYSFDYETIKLTDECAHLLANFSCGNPEIERYVREDAINHNENGKGVTYIVTDKDKTRLIAYYTLASTALVYFQDKEIGIPSIEIKMFAVNNSHQDLLLHEESGKETLVSDVILGSVIAQIYDIALNVIGTKAIVLHSVPEAVDFYTRNSFYPLDEYGSLQENPDYTKGCKPMYMPLFDF